MSNPATNCVWWWMNTDEKREDYWRNTALDINKKAKKDKKEHGSDPSWVSVRALSALLKKEFAIPEQKINFFNDMAGLAIAEIDWFDLSYRLLDKCDIGLKKSKIITLSK